ncbi:hypothetical protein T492DRAFT_1074608 [Pavlovales sp. CCMP2436]|nr:hypothetical protein T492DRAFT_1074608 [Pavlovales sp. CCMP2436]
MSATTASGPSNAREFFAPVVLGGHLRALGNLLACARAAVRAACAARAAVASRAFFDRSSSSTKRARASPRAPPSARFAASASSTTTSSSTKLTTWGTPTSSASSSDDAQLLTSSASRAWRATASSSCLLPHLCLRSSPWRRGMLWSSDGGTPCAPTMASFAPRVAQCTRREPLRSQ